MDLRKYFVLIIFCFLALPIHAKIFWQPYPINVTIGSNGAQNRLECAVYDSVLGSWQFYNSPYFNSSIDTSGGPEGIVVFRTNPLAGTNNDSIFGFITYDPILHQFAPVIKSNPDPDTPGAWLHIKDGVVGIHQQCCMVSGGSWGNEYDEQVEVYIYDINIHSWRGGIVETGDAFDEPWLGLDLDEGGYSTSSYDDVEWNPMRRARYYSPLYHGFHGLFYYWGWDMYGNQDLHYGNFDLGLSDNLYKVRTYDPWYGFLGFDQDSAKPDFIGLQIIYYHDTPNAIKFFGIMDEYFHTWVKDTITDTLALVNIKENVVAYTKPNVSPPSVYYQVYSSVQHQWIKDSMIVANGIASLNIVEGTVKWADNSGFQYKAGYDEATGWGNYDTPLQLQCMITDVFDSTGIPMIFVRDFSIGTDSVRFHFSDGGSTSYSQGSTWHQFKVNGSYSSSPNDTVEICMETVNSQGVQISCTTHVFTTPLVAGISNISDSLICPGDSIMLTVSGHNGSVQWQKNVIANPQWIDITSPGFDMDSVMLFPDSNTIYRAKIYDGVNPFVFTNRMIIKVIPNYIYAAVVSPDSICRGMPFTLSIDSFPGALSFNWTLDSSWTGSSTTSSIEVIADVTGYATVSANTLCGTTYIVSSQIDIISLDTSVYYSVNQNELVANLWDADLYQWVTCPSMQPVPGTWWDYYEPSQSGSYAVIIFKDGCIDTSNCHDVIIVGLAEGHNQPSIEIFPSPVTDILNINCTDLPYGYYQIELVNTFGQKVQEERLKIDSDKVHSKMNLSKLAQGIYFLNMKSEKYSKVLRIDKK